MKVVVVPNLPKETTSTLLQYKANSELLAKLQGVAKQGNLDATDIVILHTIQQQGTTSSGELSSTLKLSAPQTSRRIKRLLELNLIAENLGESNYRQCTLAPTSKCGNVIYEIQKQISKDAFNKAVAICSGLLLEKETLNKVMPMAHITLNAVRIVHALAMAKGSLTVGCLVEICALPQSSVSSALNQLCKREIIVKTRGGSTKDDYREVYVGLSQQSEERLHALSK